MKVLFATRVPPDVIAWKAQEALPRARHMPCDLVECYSATDVRNHIGTADAIILDNGYRYVPFWNDILFLNRSSVFTGRFHMDLWHVGEYGAPASWQEDSIKFDARITACNTLQRQYKPEWKKVFWSPHCVNVSDYDIPRDIDVLVWGASGSSYPFRKFVQAQLKSCIIKQIEQPDPFLTIYKAVVKDYKFRYATVRFVPNPVNWKPSQDQMLYGYYGPRLFRLLSRVKISCTGPAWGVPVGKYFEHAACGVVTLSTDFTDREALEFEHKKNIWITDKKYFLKDLTYLLEHPDLVAAISRNAKELIRSRHTPAIRGRELCKFLCEEVSR